jgi:hypothetical protein
MASEQRIYKVAGAGVDNNVYLVQASSQAQALRHIAGKLYQIDVAKAIDVAAMMGQGASVEVAATIPEQSDLLTEGKKS